MHRPSIRDLPRNSMFAGLLLGIVAGGLLGGCAHGRAAASPAEDATRPAEREAGAVAARAHGSLAGEVEEYASASAPDPKHGFHAAADQGLADANNPLANMTAVNFQNYYIGELTESDDSANQFWVRFAKPFSIGKTNWILRASLPVNTFPTPPDGSRETGLGDFNVFAAYLIDVGNPAVSFGIGPQLTVPTATDDALGSEKWSAGFANVLFDGRSKKFQWGYLLTWQHSFAGDDDRADVNVGAFQPFAFYQLEKGWYLRAAPIWAYDFENDAYSVPVGVGVGRAIRKGDVVYNMFVEPQFSIADKGPGQPEWQVFFALNLQFLG